MHKTSARDGSGLNRGSGKTETPPGNDNFDFSMLQDLNEKQAHVHVTSPIPSKIGPGRAFLGMLDTSTLNGTIAKYLYMQFVN